ncbi:MAG: DUF438 domain-containing protein [Bacilli bacterium]|nr:DUF438 domain-containing protein [Bacilli bacterium]
MSEFINNREEYQKVNAQRQEKLKALILRLHDGESFESVKQEFEKEFGSVSVQEITQLEQALISQGMPVAEVQRLCDVHSAVFRGSIDEIHGITPIRSTMGHPVNTMLRENQVLKNFLSVKFPFHLDLLKENDTPQNREKIKKDLEYIWQIDKHYTRKENLLFPYLERYGIYGPAKVMWGKDDEAREYIKELMQNVLTLDLNTLLEKINQMVAALQEMMFKEEEILLPMAEEYLTQDEWLKIQEESDEFGYAFIEKPEIWIPKKAIDVEETEDLLLEPSITDGVIKFDTGIINLKDLELMLNTLPVDITFIDKDDVVRFYSHGKERIFARTKSVIGRNVQNCHPPKSVHIVNKILEDFKSGKKDHEDFWIKMQDMFVLIRYFAVRDENNNYVGTLEVTQNIKPIQEITGEKRLLEE